MPAGQQVALEPALAEVLAEDLHHPAVRAEVVVGRPDARPPRPVGRLETAPRRFDAVSSGPKSRKFVRVRAHDVAQEGPEHARRLAAASRPAPGRRPRSRGSRAARSSRAAGRRWRADWRPSAGRPRVPGASERRRAARRPRRTAPPAGSERSHRSSSARCSGCSRVADSGTWWRTCPPSTSAGPGPALGRAQHDHRPAGRRRMPSSRACRWISAISSSASSSVAAMSWCMSAGSSPSTKSAR